MKKYTFDCKLIKTGKWGNKVVIVAENKNEAIEKLSKLYSHKIRYYSSNILEEDIVDFKQVEQEENKVYNEIYFDNKVALAMIIGSVGSCIAGNQITLKNATLNTEKKMSKMDLETLYKSANSIVKF